VAVRLARVRERRDPAAAAPVGDRALELARGRLRIAEREVRDGTSRPPESRQKSAIQRLYAR
jgi:hypothetical protein